MPQLLSFQSRFGILNAEREEMAQKKGKPHRPKRVVPGLGRKLREAREAVGTVAIFAEKSGISAGMISQVENELHNLSLPHFMDWCHAAGVTAGSLLDPDVDERAKYLRAAQKLRATIGLPDMEWMAELDRIEAKIAIQRAREGVGYYRQEHPAQPPKDGEIHHLRGPKT